MIKKLYAKNGLSYGNDPIEIDFTKLDGIVLVKGSNGAGKTNIINILEYAIYGKSRKFKKESIPNWSNKAFYSEVVLEDEFANDNNNETKIIRGISPDICKLEGRDNKYSKPNLDKFIANEVIGIPHELFINTVLLSVSDYKSFLDMKDVDKTKIIDKLFSTDYYSDMLTISKKKASLLDKDVSNLVALIEDKNKTIADLNLKITNIEDVNPNDISSKITEIKNSINIKSIELQDKKIELPTLESKLNSLIVEIGNKINEKQKAIFDINNKRNIKNNEINKQYNLDSIKIENEENDNVQSQIQILTSEYNTNIQNKELSIKSKIEANDNKYKDYRITIVSPQFNSEITKINDDMQKVLKDNLSKEASDIHEAASNKDLKLEECNKRITENNALIKGYEIKLIEYTNKLNEANSDIKITENSIKLYEQGRCEMCTVELHNNEYHDARKKTLESSLIALKEQKEYNESQAKSYNDDINNLKLENSNLSNEISETKIKAIKLVTQATETKNKLDSIAQSEFNCKKTDITERYKKLNDDKKTEIDSENSALTKELNEYKNSLFSSHNSKVKEIEDNKRKLITDRQEELRKLVDSDRFNIGKEFDFMLMESDTSFNSLIDGLNERKQVLDSEVLSMKSLCFELESSIKAMEGQIEMFTLSMQNSNMSIQLHKMIDDLGKEVDGLYAKRLELMEKIEVYEDLNYLLGENGIKTEYLKQILPLFNQTIEEVCDRLNFRYRFTFNEQFDVNLSWNGCKIPNNISKGQESVVNLAISLASIKMILMRKQKINIMFLDELFSNLDPEVIDLAVSMLSEFAKSYGVTLFIMSHTPIPMAHISHIMEVKFDGNYSSLSIDKC